MLDGIGFVLMCCGSSDGEVGLSSSVSNRRRMRMRVMYDGTLFQGWQLQKRGGARSVQGDLEEALTRRLGRMTRVVGASRTDRGVHAVGQVAHFDVEGSEIDGIEAEEYIGQLEFSLNRMLAADVRIAGLEIAPRDPAKPANLPFHAIFDAKGKIYTYRFQNAGIVSPLHRHNCTLIFPQCDPHIMQSALDRFVGTHDFTGFANSASRGIASVQPVRTIRSAQLIDEGNGTYTARIHLDGALYRMVRNIMGTVFTIGAGKLPVDSVDELLAKRNRRLVPKAAAAHGLCLEQIFYDI